MNKFRTRLLFAHTMITAFVLMGLGFFIVQFMSTAESGTMWPLVMTSFMIALLVIFLLSFRVIHQLTRPIERVTQMANELAKGNYTVRRFNETNDELGQLARSINILASNLDKTTKNYQQQQERLEALIDHMGSGLLFIDKHGQIALANPMCDDIFQTDTNQWLGALYYESMENQELIAFIQKIFLLENNERTQIRMEKDWIPKHYEAYGTPIIGPKDELRGVAIVLHDISGYKRLEKVRKDFVANVSHELKTPVTSLKGFAETLLSEHLKDDEVRKQFLEIIWKESNRLQDLIDDLLELSRIEHEYFRLDMYEFALADICEETGSLLEDHAEKKDINLTVETHGDTTLLADPARIKQIVINLLTNAIIYTPNKGTVSLHAYPEGEFIVCKVSDTGMGIEKSELPRIFERFYRVDKARSRDSGGTGLGLAIVKHLLEAHHGNVQVESEPGVGTTFTVRLPKS